METIKLDYELLDDKYTKHIKDNSKSNFPTLSEIMVKPSGCVLPKVFLKYFEKLKNFEVFPDDTWIITYPKAGTTWTQEMVWLLKNNMDFDKAKTIQLTVRTPFLELEAIETPVDPAAFVPDDLFITIEDISKMDRPRCIKSHLPVDLLPKKVWTVKPKIIYVSREPRDVAISFFHHYRLWSNYQGKLEDFIDVFLNDRCIYSPYWGHVLGYHDLKDKSHILFNTYEEMIKDLGEVIRKTAKFLDVKLTNDDVERMREHLSFKNMKTNSKVNYMEMLSPIVEKYGDNVEKADLKFIRKGKSGEWKEVFNDVVIEKFKKWNEHHLKNRLFKDYPW